MASRAKPKNTTSRTTRRRKPATIDLDAKEVVKEPVKDSASTSANKPEPTTTAASATSKDSGKQDTAKAEDTKFGRQQDRKLASGTGSIGSQSNTASSKAFAPRSGGGFVGMITSAVAGAVITIAGLGTLGQMEGAGKLPFVGSLFSQEESTAVKAVDSAEIAELKNQFEELSSQVASNSGSASTTMSFDNSVSAIEARISKLEKNTPSTPIIEEQIADFERRMNAIDEALSEIAAIETEGTASDPQLAISVSELSSRLESVDSAIKSQIADLQNSIEELSRPESVNLELLNMRISAIEQSLEETRGTVAGYAGKMTALENISTELSGQIASAKISEKVARSIAANALGSAIEDGEALAIPLSSIEALIGETPEIARLVELSKEGIADIVEIKREFDDFASSVLAPKPTKDGDFLTKLLHNAQSLVSIRPSDPVEGDDIPAILSRIRGQVQEGSLGEIAAEWRNLPEEIRVAGANWMAKVKSRLEAMALYKKISLQMNAS